MVDLDNNFFLVKLNKQKDYDNALMGGPWTTMKPRFHKWKLSFEDGGPRLPYRYYTKGLLRIISKVLGKITKVNYNTTEAKRGRFALLAVVIDMKKPLMSCVGIDDHVQYMEYGGVLVIYYECSCYGHTKESHLNQQRDGKKVDLTEPTMVLAIGTMTTTIVGAAKDPVSLYKPWMQALTHWWRPNISGKSKMKGKQDQLLVEGVSKSRFQIFEDNDDENEVVFDKETQYYQMKNK